MTASSTVPSIASGRSRRRVGSAIAAAPNLTAPEKPLAAPLTAPTALVSVDSELAGTPAPLADASLQSWMDAHKVPSVIAQQLEASLEERAAGAAVTVPMQKTAPSDAPVIAVAAAPAAIAPPTTATAPTRLRRAARPPV